MAAEVADDVEALAATERSGPELVPGSEAAIVLQGSDLAGVSNASAGQAQPGYMDMESAPPAARSTKTGESQPRNTRTGESEVEPIAAPAKPAKPPAKIRLDTSAIDGLRGLAAFHVALGHFVMFADMGTSPPPAESPAAAGQICPAGWAFRGGLCYHRYCDRVGWDEAASRCAGVVSGAHLATFDGNTLNGTQLADNPLSLEDDEGPYWFGLRRQNEQWEWSGSGGGALPEPAWSRAEPDNRGGDEDCAAYTYVGFFDSACGGTLWPYYWPASFAYYCSVAPNPDSTPESEAAATRADGGDACDNDSQKQQPWDLMGAGSMGLFYIVSGFVMTLGYGQRALRPSAGPEDSSVCGHRCDEVCCQYCDRPAGCCGCCGPLDCPSLRESIEMPTPGAALPEPGKVFDARGFLRKRLARLVPVYYLTNVCGCALAVCTTGLLAEGAVTIPIRMGLTAVGATSYFGAYLPFGNDPTWSISTMFFFYLCYPALAPRLQQIRKDRLRLFALKMYLLQATMMVFLLTSAWPAGSSWTYWLSRCFPPARLPVFVMGTCCGFDSLERKRYRDRKEVRPARAYPEPFSRRILGMHPADGIFFIWVFITVIGMVIQRYQFPIERRVETRWVVEMLLPIMFYDWMMALTDEGGEGRSVVTVPLFRSRPFQFIGDISMCYYMIHVLVVKLLSRTPGIATSTRPSMPPWMIPVAIALSTLFGWALTRFFEKPMGSLIRGDGFWAGCEFGKPKKKPPPPPPAAPATVPDGEAPGAQTLLSGEHSPATEQSPAASPKARGY